MPKKRDFKRVVAMGDLHCGHRVGLTPPKWQSAIKGNKYHKIQVELWEEYKNIIKHLQPIDALIVNGDCIDGRGERSGGTELISTNRQEQINMAATCINFCSAKKVVLTRGCLTAGHRILTSDLRWVPVETLKKDDRLLAFEADPKVKGRKRRFKESVVLGNVPTNSFCYKLYLSDGTTIEATHDHPFLVRNQPYQWRTPEMLYKWMYYSSGKRNKRDPVVFPRTLPVWEHKKDFITGYLAGFYDGEGSCSQRKKKQRNGWPEHIFSIDGYQNPGVVLEEVKEYLNLIGFSFGEYKYNKESETKAIRILGGIPEKLRFLGMVRPFRFLESFDPNIIGTIHTKTKEDTYIEKIELVGYKEVWGLSTSTQTYISEGFLSHNTPYHVGSQEDWEDELADKVSAIKVGDHEFYDINGVTFDVKHHIGSSSIPHGRHTAIARDAMWNAIWAEYEMQPKGEILLRSHVHYYSRTGGVDWEAFTLPALQGMGSKYGAKICSGLIHWGLIWFDVYNKPRKTGKKWEMDTHIVKIKSQKATVTKL